MSVFFFDFSFTFSYQIDEHSHAWCAMMITSETATESNCSRPSSLGFLGGGSGRSASGIRSDDAEGLSTTTTALIELHVPESVTILTIGPRHLLFEQYGLGILAFLIVRKTQKFYIPRG